MAVLEVGLEEVGHLAGLLAPRSRTLARSASSHRRPASPRRQPSVDEPVGQLVVAGDRRGLSSAVAVSRSSSASASCSSIVRTAWPSFSRRPTAGTRARRRARRPARLAVVDEHEVEVALRRQLAAPVPADGDQGDGDLRRRGVRGHGVGDSDAATSSVASASAPAERRARRAPGRRAASARRSVHARLPSRQAYGATLARCRRAADVPSCGWWSSLASPSSWSSLPPATTGRRRRRPRPAAQIDTVTRRPQVQRDRRRHPAHRSAPATIRRRRRDRRSR